MKSKLSFLLLVFAMVLGTSMVFAQPKEQKFTPEQQATRMTEHMTKVLQLNDVTKAKLYTINLKYIKEQEALRSQQDKHREAMENLKDAKIKEINSILTKEQQAALEEHNKKMQQRRPEGGPQGGPRKGAKAPRTPQN